MTIINTMQISFQDRDAIAHGTYKTCYYLHFGSTTDGLNRRAIKRTVPQFTRYFTYSGL
jgi:hypothetical protein